MWWPFRTARSLERQVRESWGGRQWVRVSFDHSNTGFPDEYLNAARALAAKAKGLRVPVLVYFTRNTVGVSTSSGSPSKFACGVGVAWPADPVANETMTTAIKECNLYKASMDENMTAARVLDEIPRRASVCKIWRVNFTHGPAVNFGKKDERSDTSLCEIPITTVQEDLPKNRNHPAFKTLKEQYPTIPDEHIDVLMRFAFASGVLEKEGAGALARLMLGFAAAYKNGSFVIKESGGNYCLYG